MNTKTGYHYGLTIREYRQRQNMTQSELAAIWPGKNQEGVSIRYLQDIESGEKVVKDIQTVRKIAIILHIPLWRLGIHEFDPFDEQPFTSTGADTMFTVSMDTAETLIGEAWRVRLSEPLFVTETIVSKLQHQFDYMVNNSPPVLRDNKRFLRLYAQIERLQAVMYVEKRQYHLALKKFYDMLETAKLLDEPATLALAHMGIGIELGRACKNEWSILFLEAARDYTFSTSKNLAALINAFLARAYANNGDVTRFERTIDTAINLGTHLGNVNIDTTDFVFHSQSGILEEKSNGYIALKSPQKALLALADVEKQINLENNLYLKMWIPLDWAQSMLLSEEVEESVKEVKEFFRRSSFHKSPHVLSHAFEHARQLERAGYGNVQAVREFREELAEYARRLEKNLVMAAQEANNNKN